MHYFYENRFDKSDSQIPLSIYINTNFNYWAHWHTELELAYVESGSIWVGINNDRRKLVTGDLAISTSGDIHYYESQDPNSKIILLIFKPEFFSLPADWPSTHQFTASFFSKKEASTKIRPILYSILKERQNRKAFYEQFIKAKVIELCASLLRYLPTTTIDLEYAENIAKQKHLQEILVYIENHFTEDISLQLLAEKFTVDPFNLSKSFNAITGSNLRYYINTLRVTKAKNLITNTRKPLIEIAFECGFNSVRTFNRAFKQMNGHPPSALREKNE